MRCRIFRVIVHHVHLETVNRCLSSALFDRAKKETVFSRGAVVKPTLSQFHCFLTRSLVRRSLKGHCATTKDMVNCTSAAGFIGRKSS